TRRLPIEVDRNHNPGRGRNHLDRLHGYVIEPILICISYEDVMSGMAFVSVAIKEIVTLSLISTSSFSSNGRRAVSLERKAKAIVFLKICRS
ncbi:MAG TPA: hypothetical protein VK551_05730, partial [Thermodesulfobacteriota bacterium]|nr:hypothetical protein [Thermodesulfobacteriota bacterium]